MSERGCTHGITLARYAETCAECGQVVAERPPNEAAMREALEGLLSLDWHSIVVPDAADAKVVLDQARRTLASLSPPSTNEERCGAVSLDGVTCQLVEGHQGVHKNDARHWRNAAHPATNGDREGGS